MQEREIVELVFASLTFVLAIVLGHRALARPENVSLFDIVFLSSGMFFGLGSWFAFYYGNGTLPYAEPALIFEAFCTIAFYLLGIFCTRLVFEKWRTRVQSNRLALSLKELSDCFRGVRLPTIILMASLLWIARIHRGIVHDIWFSGVNEEAFFDIPYYWVVVYTLSFTVGYACFLWSVRAFWDETSSWVRLTAGCLIVLEFGWLFLSGRRCLIEWMMFVAVGYLASGRRLNWRMILVGALGLGLVYSFFFPLFVNIRYLYQGGYSADENAIMRFMDLLMQAMTFDSGEVRFLVDENMAERPLIHRFICEILQGQRIQPLMMGEALYSTFLWAIPSGLLANKHDLLETEQFIQSWYGMPLEDTSTTWPALGCADFGIGGGFIAGLLVGLIVIIAQWLATRLRRDPFIALCLVGGMMDLAFQVECDPMANWTLFRNILLLWLIGNVIKVIANAGSRRQIAGN